MITRDESSTHFDQLSALCFHSHNLREEDELTPPCSAECFFPLPSQPILASLSVGDYDVEIPCNTPAGEYSIRVGRFEDPSLFDCSDPFTVVADEDSGSMSYRL